MPCAYYGDRLFYISMVLHRIDTFSALDKVEHYDD